mgnify:CR=1 FL=1
MVTGGVGRRGARVECPAAVRVRDIRTHLSEDSPFIVSKTCKIIVFVSCRQSACPLQAQNLGHFTLSNVAFLLGMHDGSTPLSETVNGAPRRR